MVYSECPKQIESLILAVEPTFLQGQNGSICDYLIGEIRE